MFQKEHKSVVIGFPDATEMCELYLFVKRFQHGVNLRVPSDLTVGGLVSLLVEKLDLPTKASVQFLGKTSYDAVWCLHRSDDDALLEEGVTFRHLGLPAGATVHLVGTFHTTMSVRYMGGGSSHKHVAVFSKGHGWVAGRGTGDDSFVDEFISSTIGRRQSALFAEAEENVIQEVSLSDVIRQENEEDRQLPTKRLTLKVSDIQFKFLAHALVNFGGGFSIDAFSTGSIEIEKEKMGNVMRAYGAFHQVLETKRKSLAERFNDMDDVCAQSSSLKTELLNQYLWIGPGPGSVTFSKE
ncbi:MAG: hypothetical protein JNL62_17550 [Bryobacterales bacterium]|nr:hypothetical protein [Bryobacterales bacterium]